MEQSNKLNSFKHARPCIEVSYIVHVIVLFLPVEGDGWETVVSSEGV